VREPAWCAARPSRRSRPRCSRSRPAPPARRSRAAEHDVTRASRALPRERGQAERAEPRRDRHAFLDRQSPRREREECEPRQPTLPRSGAKEPPRPSRGRSASRRRPARPGERARGPAARRARNSIATDRRPRPDDRPGNGAREHDREHAGARRERLAHADGGVALARIARPINPVKPTRHCQGKSTSASRLKSWTIRVCQASPSRAMPAPKRVYSSRPASERAPRTRQAGARSRARRRARRDARGEPGGSWGAGAGTRFGVGLHECRHHYTPDGFRKGSVGSRLSRTTARRVRTSRPCVEPDEVEPGRETAAGRESSVCRPVPSDPTSRVAITGGRSRRATRFRAGRGNASTNSTPSWPPRAGLGRGPASANANGSASPRRECRRCERGIAALVAIHVHGGKPR